ncbi:efflux RND transporter permease subunit [Rhodobacter ferrooxidans]|uniref:RND efflux transporter n=1 Tax=Rhodobacter ferrooxidans TaxID=371731 RepID=C8RZP0_9RHOB|nr:hypothetical protein [Rhodobacter sp. SW2]EEW25837.1 RND efflux transporter [Rhodobacter sp. SW2]
MRRFSPQALLAGLLAHRWLVALVLALLIPLAAWQAQGVRARVDMDALLDGNSPAFTAWRDLERRFVPFSRDEVFVVTSDAGSLAAPGQLDALQDLLIELNLTPGVAATLSILALPASDDSGVAWLATPAALALEPADRLAGLRAGQAMAGQMISADLSATLVLVMPEPAADNPALVAEILAIAKGLDNGLQLRPAGLNEMSRTAASGLVQDQVWLIPASVVLCLAISFWLLGSWRAVLICGAPPLTGTLWFLGWLGWRDLPIDQFMALVPIVLIVLAFSDCIHLYTGAVAAQAEAQAQGAPPDAAARKALSQIFPAVFMTNMSTSVGFLCLLVVQAPALHNLAISGSMGMLLTFSAEVLMLPLLFSLVGGTQHRLGARLPKFGPLRRLAQKVAGYPRQVVLGVALLMAGLIWVENVIPTGYSLSEHIAPEAPVIQTLRDLERLGLASDSLQVVVADADGQPGLSDADRRLLGQVAGILYHSSDDVTAALQLWAQKAPDAAVLRRFVAEDQLAYDLPLSLTADDSGARLVSTAADLTATFAAAGLADKVQINGYSLMLVQAVPKLITKLQWGFYLEILLITLVIWASQRSPRLALVALLPNVIPILCVDGWLYLSGQEVTLTSAVATTVAFGLAVDNGIHVLNHYRLASGSVAERIHIALAEAAPPILTTTVLLLGGFCVVAFSVTPSVTVFGTLVVLALTLVCVSSLLLLPGIMRWSLR